MTDVAPQDVLLISDFNAGNFAGYLRNAEGSLSLEPRAAPYGQVSQLLLDPDHPVWEEEPDATVVWARARTAVPSFAAVLEYDRPDPDALLEEVDAYAELLGAAAERTRTLLVPSWTRTEPHRGWGMLDAHEPFGLSHALGTMNLRLAERLRELPNAFLLDAGAWLQAAGPDAFNPHLWYMAKVPFGNAVFREAAADVMAALEGVRGHARKIVILDLDDTVWGGIVGDVGWESLRLGGHDATGEAYVAFQKALRALTARGVLLAVVSKNEEEVALEAIAEHPEMVLTPEDLAGWRINWEDKARNIAELMDEVSLGLQSAVFIDDNPVERARVREALPEVLVPDWPEDPRDYAAALHALRCFDTPAVTREDLERARMYASERQRSEIRSSFSSLDDWLESLETTITVEPLDDANRARVLQLLNKTNQMNLSTRRLTDAELTEWCADPDHLLRAFRVSDRFGDAGLTGIGSLALGDGEARIVDFVLSCRVMGRKVEETIVAVLVEEARRRGGDRVTAVYEPTAKNKPCLRFWTDSGFDQPSDHLFVWDASEPYPRPEQVRVAREDLEASAAP